MDSRLPLRAAAANTSSEPSCNMGSHLFSTGHSLCGPRDQLEPNGPTKWFRRMVMPRSIPCPKDSRGSLSPEAHPSEVLHPCRSLALTWQIPGRMLIQTERLALQNFSIRSACICCSRSDRSVPGDEGSHGRRVERVRLSRQERKDTQTMRSDGDTWTSSVASDLPRWQWQRSEHWRAPVRRDHRRQVRIVVRRSCSRAAFHSSSERSHTRGHPFGGFMGLRTRFFDEFFSSSTESGVRQAVIVAAGLIRVRTGWIELRIDGIRSGSAKGAGLQSRSARGARRPAEDR
ncbi:class I SAM-dependent methyltransferase [Rhodococcus sp. 3Y1]